MFGAAMHGWESLASKGRGMGDFFAELKRRHVYRVAAAYVVVAWLILQVINNVAPGLNLPNSAVTLVIVLLAAGFPIALIFAWIFDIKATGPADVPAPKANTTALDFVLAGGLAAVIAIFAYEQVAAPGGRSVQRLATGAAAAPKPQPGGISVAVLPFVNLSSDKEQEFFSDGMTEEITSALAKISNLRVVGRTSAFQFKGQNKDLTAIGQALHATHLIEGSVRKDGNEVRITAQLIQADDGTHLWTESYNRELKGVFAIQEEIATAIASALRVPLGLKEGQSLVVNRTPNTDSYEDYLRARALVRARGALEPGGPLTEAAKLLEQVVARDPNYAPAWGLLALAYALAPNFSDALNNGSTDDIRRAEAQSLQQAELAAQQATRLDPNNVDGYTALALARHYRGAFVRAEDSFKQALSLDPGSPEALHLYGIMLANVGRSKDSLAMRLRLQAQEPLVPIFNQITALVLWLNRRNDEAIGILKASSPTNVNRGWLAQVDASMGRYGEAADALREMTPGMFRPGVIEEAVRLLRSAPAPAASPQTTLSNRWPGFVYLYAGAPNEVLDFYESLAEAGYPAIGNIPSFLWAPAYAPVRKTERFRAYARKAGMVDYWRERGWPDLCRPMAADDFVCD
jgi:adenylate cyclase